VSHYLKHRTNLCFVFALIDAELSPQEIDIEFVEWLARNAVPFVLVFTKTDKLSAVTVQANIRAFTERIAPWFEKPPAIFTSSATLGQGRQELLDAIGEAMAAIEAESGQSAHDPAGAPEGGPVPNRQLTAQKNRKKRPDLARPW
jgi:GTP-binding protein